MRSLIWQIERLQSSLFDPAVRRAVHARGVGSKHASLDGARERWAPLSRAPSGARLLTAVAGQTAGDGDKTRVCAADNQGPQNTRLPLDRKKIKRKSTPWMRPEVDICTPARKQRAGCGDVSR